jgi:hypothetical protein
VRQLIWLLLVLYLVACGHKAAPELPHDAGSTETTPDPHVQDAVNLAGQLFGRQYDKNFAKKVQDASKIRSHPPRNPPKPNPPVDACTESATDKASLMGCLSAPPAPSDGGTVKFASAIRPPSHCPALDVAAWHVNDSTGNNNNTCTDSAHPCKDPQEVFERWGCGGPPNLTPLFTSTSTLYLDSDLPSSTMFSLSPEAGLGANFTIQCATTVFATGLTLGAVTLKNRPIGQYLNVNLGAGASSYVGLLIHNITRSSINYVDSIVSGNVALVVQPVATSDDATEVDTWTAGDSYEILRPSQVYLSKLRGKYAANSTLSLRDCWQQGGSQSPDIGGFEAIQESRFDVLSTFTGTTGFATLVKAATGYNVWWYSSSLTSFVFDSGNSQVDGTAFQGVGNNVDNDTVIHSISGLDFGTYLFYGKVYIDFNFEVQGNLWNILDGSPKVYGPYVITTDPGATILFPYGGAVSTFVGVGNPNGGQIGATQFIAFDRKRSPAQWYSGRSLNPTLLDQTDVPGGGYDGVAILPTLIGGFISPQPNPVVLPYSAPPGNGGTGLDAGCADGSILEGTGLTTPFMCEPESTFVSTIAVGGDLQGTLPNPLIGALHGTFLSGAAPTTGQELVASTFTPAALPGLQWWLSAGAGVSLSGSTVTSWADQSGHGHNATPTGSPQYTAAGGPNSLPAIIFNGANGFSNSGSNILPQGNDRAIFVVMHNGGSPTSPATFVTNGSSALYNGFFYNPPSLGTQYIYSNGTALTTVTTTDTGIAHLLEWDVRVGSLPVFYLDGTAQSVAGSNFFAETGSAGYLVGLNPSGQYYNGQMSEVLEIDHIPTPIERNALGGWVQSKYAITVASSAGALAWTPTTVAGGGPPTGAAGGDLTGTYPNPQVDQLTGGSFGSGTVVRFVNGSAPSGLPSGAGYMWAGSGELFWKDPAGVVTQLTPLGILGKSYFLSGAPTNLPGGATGTVVSLNSTTIAPPASGFLLIDAHIQFAILTGNLAFGDVIEYGLSDDGSTFNLRDKRVTMYEAISNATYVDVTVGYRYAITGSATIYVLAKAGSPLGQEGGTADMVVQYIPL